VSIIELLSLALVTDKSNSAPGLPTICIVLVSPLIDISGLPDTILVISLVVLLAAMPL